MNRPMWKRRTGLARHFRHGSCLATLVALAALATATPALAAEALRVCTADNDMPYTSPDRRGFEDRLADLLARQLASPVERVQFNDPRYVVRDGIDKRNCDVMMGVDAGDPRLQTTAPYYRSSYVFLTRTADGLEIRDWEAPVLRQARIGVVPGTPAETMLRQIGRHSDSFRYLMSLGGNKSMRNRFVRYDVEKLVRDLADGEIDVAVAWAPSVARYVRDSRVPLTATTVPDSKRSDGEPVAFSYDTAIGVRKDNAALRTRIESALQALQPEVAEILTEEGIAALALSRPAASPDHPKEF